MFFLSSLPRSGSTLLASLLNQRPDTFVSNTSNLQDVMGAAVSSWESNPATTASGAKHDEIISVLRGIADGRYANRREKNIFDKSRGWPEPQIIKTMTEVQSTVKIVATVRPIADCMASLVRIAKPENVDNFCKNSQLATHFFHSYSMLKAGYEAYPECFLFVDYDELILNTTNELHRVCHFIDAPVFQHDLENVPPSGELDEVWGVDGLHDVRPVIKRQEYSVQEVLGNSLFDMFQGGEFWNDTPEPVRPVDALDLQLQASLRGDFDEAAAMTDTLLQERPECNRTKFNAGWHYLRAGDLQAGHKMLDHGRAENVFGNKCLSYQPVWAGENGTVLLNMEGGLGDQIKSYRFAFDIKARGNQVVIACSPELAPMFAENFITVQHEAVGGVFHDFYCPSMSAVIPLGHTYESLSGDSYIQKTSEAIPGRVGVRWSGNPKFEHEQHRAFPKNLMFNTVRDVDCVSLQRDTDDVPSWMRTPCLDTWEDTRKAISECELVISSCTSVGHLAAAMGIKTFIVVPILPYYLWALPGDVTTYYNSVTLFRQEKYGDWSAPFEQIKEKLKCYMHTLKIAA